MKPLRRRRPGKNQVDILRSLQAKFPEMARQLQPATPAAFKNASFVAIPWCTWFYGLCEACFQKPGVTSLAEARVLAEVKAGKASFN